jgi:hypothetical protein
MLPAVLLSGKVTRLQNQGRRMGNRGRTERGQKYKGISSQDFQARHLRIRQSQIEHSNTRWHTNEGSKKYAHVSSKRKVAESSSLRLLRTVLCYHCTDRTAIVSPLGCFTVDTSRMLTRGFRQTFLRGIGTVSSATRSCSFQTTR